MNLHKDLPEDGDGPQYVLRIEFDETELQFYVFDDSDRAAELEDETRPSTELGRWREASLWFARQLLSLGSPVATATFGEETVGGPDDGSHPFSVIGSPSRVARDLTDEEVLKLLDVGYDPMGDFFGS
jgi:hypothetical protein